MIRVRDALILTALAWFVGLVADVNLEDGMFMFRTLLPVMAMGGSILYALNGRQPAQQEEPDEPADSGPDDADS